MRRDFWVPTHKLPPPANQLALMAAVGPVLPLQPLAFYFVCVPLDHWLVVHLAASPQRRCQTTSFHAADRRACQASSIAHSRNLPGHHRHKLCCYALAIEELHCFLSFSKNFPASRSLSLPLLQRGAVPLQCPKPEDWFPKSRRNGRQLHSTSQGLRSRASETAVPPLKRGRKRSTH